MTRRPRNPLRVLESRRLTLVAATPDLVAADLAGLEGLRLAALVLGQAADKLLDEDVQAAVLDEVHDAC